MTPKKPSRLRCNSSRRKEPRSSWHKKKKNKIISAKRGNYRKDKGHDHLTGGGQQIISGLQGLAAGMEGNQNIPADKANEVWKNYQLYVEQFYDMLKLNSEAREYDFKKNLEAKTQLCEAAEKLNEEEDVISAFHQLQDLHQQYREIGPVAKELREQIWERFKAASTVINKKHQQHFEDLRAKEEENLAKKTSLCEKVEAANQGEYKTAKDWEKVTQEIIEIQKEWRTIGFAPQKMNVKIFERFRIANDKFFNKKAEFFKGLKDTYSANLEKKQQLVNKAKELADSTDWKKTGDKFIALQKEWKKVGTVPHKQGELLWKEFLDTCNKFFEARNKQNAGSRSEEHANLDKKRNIIAQLKELVIAEISDNDFQKKLKILPSNTVQLDTFLSKRKTRSIKSIMRLSMQPTRNFTPPTQSATSTTSRTT